MAHHPRPRQIASRFARLFTLCSLLASLSLLVAFGRAQAQDWTLSLTDLIGPAGSEHFGQHVETLANGNFVVTDPNYDDGALSDVGAVYLFDGKTLELISQLKGSVAGSLVGSGGVTPLPNGNFVVSSPFWEPSAGASNWGAVTWVSGVSGLNGVVNASNSLVGSANEDRVGITDVTPLAHNNNYIVVSSLWSGGGAAMRGAVTYANGNTGVSGAVSALNSLVGSAVNDNVGSGGVTVLTNGNYVVRSNTWRNTGTGAVSAGAVTWASGTSGIIGEVSASNSLVGTQTHDTVGGDGVVPLANGNYVVLSTSWDLGTTADVGAVTWGNGATGTAGPVTTANSLHGTAAIDIVGNRGALALSNGNYVVLSPNWDRGGLLNAGAATWGNGSTAGPRLVGAVSTTNSLVGTSVNDGVGSGGVALAGNGNYVISSPTWDRVDPFLVVNAGASTWGSGATGITGNITHMNSLVGSRFNDRVGVELHPLANGNYVIQSWGWNAGTAPAQSEGAVTWASGTALKNGTISAENSLVGSQPDSLVGRDIVELANGNYVVVSPFWSDIGKASAGAVTWASGGSGITGVVGPANSHVGVTPMDTIGSGGVTALSNGNYVIGSPLFDNGGTVDAGAATWGNGSGGSAGDITQSNSLVGANPNDGVGNYPPIALANGNYVVVSGNWNNGATSAVGALTWGNGATGAPRLAGPVTTTNSLYGGSADDRVGEGAHVALPTGDSHVTSIYVKNGVADSAGAVTWGRGDAPMSGQISPENSAQGTVSGGGIEVYGIHDAVNDQVIVSRRQSNIVTIMRKTLPVAVEVTGLGSGEVSSTPGGIDCGSTCSAFFTVGLPITLTASANAGSAFAGWGGDCSGTSPNCVVTVTEPISVTATFVPVHTLTLTVQPPGLGTLIANPPGPNYPHGTFIEVTAVANANAAFVSWAGACPTPSTCTLSMTEDKEVVGIFAPLYTVTIHKAGKGTANPTTLPAGPQFVAGSEVIVFANLGPGTLLTSYSGDCTGSSSCQLTMNSNKVVTVTTHLESYIVTVGVVGNGTVESNFPGNIADYGTQMIYTPHPAQGWRFLEWNGACTGNNTPCAFTLTGNAHVSATFVPQGANRDIDTADVQLIGGTVDRTLAPVAVGTFTVTSSYEPGDTYTWSLDEPSAAGNLDFTLDTLSGVLMLQNNQAALGPRSLAVTVSDGRGSSISKVFVVLITEAGVDLQVWLPTVQQ